MTLRDVRLALEWRDEDGHCSMHDDDAKDVLAFVDQLTARIAELERRDAQWREAIVPGNSDTLSGRICSTPEGAAEWMKAKREFDDEINAELTEQAARIAELEGIAEAQQDPKSVGNPMWLATRMEERALRAEARIAALEAEVAEKDRKGHLGCEWWEVLSEIFPSLDSGRDRRH